MIQPRSALSKRSFLLENVPTSAPLIHSRHLKRIYVAAEILKAAKICAGDALVLRPISKLPSLASLSLENEQEVGSNYSAQERFKFAVGIAWPSFTLSGTAIAVSPLLLANAGLATGDQGSISTLASSGVTELSAEQVTFVQDGRGKADNDRFFEIYAKEIICMGKNHWSKQKLIELIIGPLIIVDVKYVAPDHFVELTYNGIIRRLVVSKVDNGPSTSLSTPTIYVVSRSTEVVFKRPGTETRGKRSATHHEPPKVLAVNGDLSGYEAIGGMKQQIALIRELVEWPLTRPELYRHFGLLPPKGILLYGPPGTGKTLLALSIAKSIGATLLTIDGPSLSSAYHGETESKLREIFAEAKRRSPTVIVIDEIDALAPNREEGGEVERRVVATLLTLMDGLEEKESLDSDVKGEGSSYSEANMDHEKSSDRPNVIVIAATNRPNAIDPALRRPGRFDKEIEIGVPNDVARLSILEVLLKRSPNEVSAPSLQSIANRTHGFVGADLASLVHTAGLTALKRSYTHISLNGDSSMKNLKVTAADFEQALLQTRPSAMREVYIETPKVLWSDIGGQDQVKARLRECVEWPLLHPESFKRLGVRPPRGVLLYGPPGCSKTLIAKALATEGGLNFIAVKGPEVFNKYVGESEKAIREIFRKARTAAPSVVFLDEVDALAPSRGSDESGGSTGDRVLMTLLTEMDGIEELNGVVVLAATNRPDVIDPALMRPGRIDRILYVSPPDEKARQDIFRLNIKKMSVSQGINVGQLAAITAGCSGAEIASVCQDAALDAMNEDVNIPAVRHEHFLRAANVVRRRISPEVLRGYEEWRDNSGLRTA